MYVESFHNHLKTFFMGRKVNKRIDDLVILLLQIEEEDYWRHKRECIYKGDQPNEVTLEARHQRGINIKDDCVEQLSEHEWKIQSSSNDDVYQIKKLLEACSDSICSVM